jgi:hypothetical protein
VHACSAFGMAGLYGVLKGTSLMIVLLSNFSLGTPGNTVVSRSMMRYILARGQKTVRASVEYILSSIVHEGLHSCILTPVSSLGCLRECRRIPGCIVVCLVRTSLTGFWTCWFRCRSEMSRGMYLGGVCQQRIRILQCWFSWF